MFYSFFILRQAEFVDQSQTEDFCDFVIYCDFLYHLIVRYIFCEVLYRPNLEVQEVPREISTGH